MQIVEVIVIQWKSKSRDQKPKKQNIAHREREHRQIVDACISELIRLVNSPVKGLAVTWCAFIGPTGRQQSVLHPFWATKAAGTVSSKSQIHDSSSFILVCCAHVATIMGG